MEVENLWLACSPRRWHGKGNREIEKSQESPGHEKLVSGVAEERRQLIKTQDLFCPSPDTQKEPQLVVLEGAVGIGNQHWPSR